MGNLDRRDLFWRLGDQRAVRRGPWKLIITKKDTTLFNLDKDLQEKINVASEHQRLVRDLSFKIAAWEREMGPQTKMSTQ